MSIDFRKRENPLFLALFLAVTCGFAVALMAGAKILTAPAIEDAERMQTELALKMVLPEFDSVTPAEFLDMVIYTAEKDGSVCGYAVLAQGSGYGGPVEGLIGFKPDGTIRTYLITKQNETPGIGSRVTTRKSVKTVAELFDGGNGGDSLPENGVLDSYSGKRAKMHRNKKTGEAFVPVTGATVSALAKRDMEPKFLSGATVSSKAVSEIAWRASNALNIYLEKKSK